MPRPGGRGRYQQEVLIDPADLGTGQASQEGGDGLAQLVGLVEREGRVVATFDLRPEPLGGAGPGMAEALGVDQLQSPGPDGRVPEGGFAVQSLLVGGEAREPAAPDRPCVLLRGPGVDEQTPAR